MRLHEIVETSRRVGQTRSRSEKVRELASCLQRCGPEAIETAIGLLTGRPRQGRIGRRFKPHFQGSPHESRR
jgi:DNA ligase-1